MVESIIDIKTQNKELPFLIDEIRKMYIYMAVIGLVIFFIGGVMV